MKQSESPKLSQDILRRYAEFARLKFSEDRLERMLPRVERYLNDIDELDEVDVGEAEPAIIFPMKKEEEDEG